MTEILRPAHRSFDELTLGLRALPAPGADAGVLRLIVRRPAAEARETPSAVTLSPEEGVPGDDWSRRPPRDPEAQLAVIRHDVATLIAGGRDIALFGDNLYVDLDLSARNLPAGSELAVGAARVVVTPMPHNGCMKFKARFGQDALRFVQARETRDQNFRGIYWRVVSPGEVRLGDPIRVLARGAPR